MLRVLLPQMIPAVAIAAVISIVCVLVVTRIKRLAIEKALGLAIAAGYGCGHLFISGWVSVPPVDSINWLPIIAPVIAIIAVILPLPPHRWIYLAVAGAVAVATLGLLLRPMLRHAWSGGIWAAWVVGLGLFVMLLMTVIDKLDRRVRLRVEVPLLLLLVCAGSSGALSMSGSLLLGLFAAVLGAALSGMLITGGRGLKDCPVANVIFSTLLIALVVSGYFFAELPATSALLLALAPAAAFIPTPIPGRFPVMGIRMGLVAVPIVLALLLAFHASPSLSY